MEKRSNDESDLMMSTSNQSLAARRFVLPALAVAALSMSAYARVNLPTGFEVVEIVGGAIEVNRPVLNNCGEVILLIKPGASWAESEIFRYDNGTTFQVTDNDDRDVLPVVSLQPRAMHQAGRSGSWPVLRDRKEITGHFGTSSPTLVVWTLIRYKTNMTLSGQH